MLLGALGALGFYPLLGPSSTPSSTPSPASSPELSYTEDSSYDSWWKEPITEYDDSYAAPAAQPNTDQGSGVGIHAAVIHAVDKPCDVAAAVCLPVAYATVVEAEAACNAHIAGAPWPEGAACFVNATAVAQQADIEYRACHCLYYARSSPSPSPSPSSKLYYAGGSSYDSWWKEPITEYDDSYAAPAASYDYDYDYATTLYYWDGNEEPLSASRFAGPFLSNPPPAFLEGVSPPPPPPPLSGGAWGSRTEELAPNN